MGTGVGDCEAHTGGDDTSWREEIRTSGGATFQDEAAGDKIPDSVGQVLYGYHVLFYGLVARVYLCSGLHRRVRLRRVLPDEVEGGRFPGTVGFYPGVGCSWLVDLGRCVGAANEALAGGDPRLQDKADTNGTL